MLVVPDINVIVSGYLWSGPSSRILAAARQGDITLATDLRLIEELSEVLARERFSRRLAALGASVHGIVDDFQELAEVHPSVDWYRLDIPLRDAEDAAVLLCAVAAQADLIVSGDEDLLVLEMFEGIPIVRPADLAYSLPVSH